ncbi:MAG: hypothetical protein M3032_05195, partial [Verrucomicrobiota bacterium]|nr:hypothetical protein [Verrucomicrobiota bacterium]
MTIQIEWSPRGTNSHFLMAAPGNSLSTKCCASTLVILPFLSRRFSRVSACTGEMAKAHTATMEIKKKGRLIALVEARQSAVKAFSHQAPFLIDG